MLRVEDCDNWRFPYGNDRESGGIPPVHACCQPRGNPAVPVEGLACSI